MVQGNGFEPLVGLTPGFEPGSLDLTRTPLRMEDGAWDRIRTCDVALYLVLSQARSAGLRYPRISRWAALHGQILEK